MYIFKRFRFSLVIFLSLLFLTITLTVVSLSMGWRHTKQDHLEHHKQRLAMLPQYVQEYMDCPILSQGLKDENNNYVHAHLENLIKKLSDINDGYLLTLHPYLESGSASHAGIQGKALTITELVNSIVRDGNQGFADTQGVLGPSVSYGAFITVQGVPIGVVVAELPMQAINQEQQDQYQRLWLRSLIHIIAGILVSIFLSKTLSENITNIARGIRQMELDPNHRLQTYNGEFGEISRAINNLARSLRDSQDILQTLLEQLPVAVVVLDNKSNITYFNRAAEKQTFLTADEALEQPYLDKFPHGRIIPRILSEGVTINDEIYRGPLLKREYAAFRVFGAPIRNEQDVIVGAIAVFSDITESDRLQQSNRQLIEQVRQAEKLAVLGELAAGTAHEIRNPLMVIQGFVQMAKNKMPEGSKERTWLEMSLEEARRINEITQEFMLLAKPTAQQRIPTDIVKVLLETLQMIDSTAFACRVKLVTNLPKGSSPICLADRQQLKQVFLNLFTNAIQAMPSGGVLSVDLNPLQEDRSFSINVTDNGVGISEADLGKIFNPFFTTRPEGTGLGLTVIARIIQNHEGAISVQSQEGKGTTFTIELPSHLM